MREFSMNNLQQMQKMLDYCKKCVDDSINFRKHLLPNIQSVNKNEIAFPHSQYHPDDYYYFKVFDKGVQLERGGDYYYESNGHQVDTRSMKDKNDLYHVHLYNWLPRKLVNCNNIHNPSARYLSTDNYDVAKKFYFKFCTELMLQCGFDVINFTVYDMYNDKELF